MIDFVKKGIKNIQETKKYAQEKNVPRWGATVIMSIIMVYFTISTIHQLFLIELSQIIEYRTFEPFVNIYRFLPEIFTFLFIMQYGKYPIRFFVLLNSYQQKLMIKAINKIDMYWWRRTGKDSVATNFIQKHPKLFKMMLFIPLIVYSLVRLF